MEKERKIKILSKGPEYILNIDDASDSSVLTATATATTSTITSTRRSKLQKYHDENQEESNPSIAINSFGSNIFTLSIRQPFPLKKYVITTR